MKTPLGLTFKSLQKLRKWLSDNKLIQKIDKPLDDWGWVNGDQENSSIPPEGFLWINSDCCPTAKNCVYIINGALEKLKEQQSAINGIEYRRCDNNDAFYFAKLGLPNGKYLIYRSTTLEELTSEKFDIEVAVEVEKEKRLCELVVKVKIKLIVKIGEKNINVQIPTYEFNYQINPNKEDGIKDGIEDRIKTEIAEMLCEYCTHDSDSTEPILIEEKLKKEVIREVLHTEFMDACLTYKNIGNQRFLINPFAAYMKNCSSLKNVLPSSLSEKSEQKIVDGDTKKTEKKEGDKPEEVKEFNKYLELEKVDYEKIKGKLKGTFKGNVEEKFNTTECGWVLRMARYLKLLAGLIRGESKISWQENIENPQKTKNPENPENPINIHFIELVGNINAVKSHIKKYENDYTKLEEDLKNKNKNISNERSKGNKPGSAINKHIFNAIKERLMTFILNHRDNWNEILIIRILQLAKNGSLKLEKQSLLIATYYLNKFSPNPLPDDAGHIK